MNIRIVTDSCIDINKDVFGNEENMERVPFKIVIENEEMIDKNLDLSELREKMKATKDKITTACPSPHDFLEAFKKCKENFVVTISEKLSGSHNSAVLAANMFLEEVEDAFVHIFDCKTATAGASLVALKLKTMIEEKVEKNRIIEEINNYIDQMKTFLVPVRLDNLAKNGRISSKKAFVGSLLQVTPIMCDNGDGELILKEQVRGRKKAFARLLDIIGEEKADFSDRVLAISHVNSEERALNLKEQILSRYNFKDIIIFEGGGLTTVYADDGGIVVCY
ncbi:DegV family protein [uncultured Clostridium sp.]|uniref:DegV family protein n=1 Tax=uncultured Clostridium sp. TaxID=59620 RepID=UPI0025FA4C82|nr:DegV family protein [uncultured Clostridium sp.]